MRCCALLLASDVKGPPFSTAEVGDAPVAAAAASVSLALAEDKVLAALPLALSIEIFLLALAALPSPILPRAAHKELCSAGAKAMGMLSMASLVERGLVTQRQAGLFGAVSAAFAAVAHSLQSAAVVVLVALLASAAFHVRCDDVLGPSAPPIAKRVSAFEHMTEDRSRRLQQECAFIRLQLGLPPR
jgi:hypothetical protein